MNTIIFKGVFGLYHININQITYIFQNNEGLYIHFHGKDVLPLTHKEDIEKFLKIYQLKMKTENF